MDVRVSRPSPAPIRLFAPFIVAMSLVTLGACLVPTRTGVLTACRVPGSVEALN